MAELTSILSEVFAGGRRFLGLSEAQQAPTDAAGMAELCRSLLSSRGEASGIVLGGEVLAGWEQLSDEERERFFDVLLTEFGPDAADLDEAINAHAADPSPATILGVNTASEPRRQELVRRLNLAPGGTATLVKMRRFLLQRLKARPDLKPVDADFLHLFNSWFNRGFLVLRPIDWSTPANILEKIIRYEAVHEIHSWDDLKRRLAPADRRCFAFFHPQLVDEPLVFVEVALTKDMPDTIEDVLDEKRPPLDPAKAQYATFYSISNCQDGLRGISFGNFLIKQVVEDLRRDLPNLSRFVTLSPVPGFARWLDAEMASQKSEFITEDEKEVLGLLQTANWHLSDGVVDQLTPVMMAVASRYFVDAKRKDGRVVDPVARFHLRNGARLERINMLADRSVRGLEQSYGLMVNYLYRLNEVEANHEAFVERGEVATSSAVRSAASSWRAKAIAGFQKLTTQNHETIRMSNHLFDAMRVTADADPKRELILPDPGPAMSYGDMLERSSLLAKLLLARGVEPGDRVAAQIDKSTDALMLYLATIRVGAVYLPLNAAYTPAEIDYFIGDAEPRIFVVMPENMQALSSVAADHDATLLTLGTVGDGTLFDADVSGIDAVDVSRAPDDLAAILYTSGTTGRSKGAVLTHDNLLSNAQTLVDLWEFTSNDKLIHALPVFHTHGLFVATNTIMLSGASMYLLPKFDAEKILDLMPKATALMGVPTFYTRLLQSDRLAKASKTMRLFVSGSAPLLAATHQQFEATTGHRILERYGMTETNMNTSNPYGSDRRPGTVGPALPGVSIRVTDPESGEALPAGEIGMVEVKGPNVFKGYWRMPEKTASEFRDDGFFITGDLGTLSDDGYLTIVGRGKDLVISGGFNIYPKEIEIEIDAIEGVAESAAIGVPHSDFGEGLVAVVVTNNGATVTDDDIIKALSDRLARFKQPKRIVFVDQLPRNTMGKVQKNVLRETFGDLFK